MNNIKRKIMRRIYVIWFARTIFNPLGIKVVLAGVFLWQLTVYVSIKNVLINSPLINGDITSSYGFFESAISNTESMTLLLIAGIVVVSALLIRDFVRHHLTSTERSLARI